jgi:hypothetical protein
VLQPEEVANILPGKSDRVSGGLALGGARFLVSLDRVVGDHLLVGGRVGYFTRPFPESSLGDLKSLHVEARATFVAGDHPFSRAGVFPTAMVGAGFAERAAGVAVTVIGHEGSSPQTLTLDTWQTGGPVFVSAGLGLRLGVGGPFVLSFLPLEATCAFGSSTLFALSPEAGVQVGF